MIPTLQLGAEIVPTHACWLCNYISPSLPKLTKHELSQHKCDCGKTNGSRYHLKTYQPITSEPSQPFKPRKPWVIFEWSYGRNSCFYDKNPIFQVENELPSNSTNEIPSVSHELPKKRRRKQEFVERNEI